MDWYKSSQNEQNDIIDVKDVLEKATKPLTREEIVGFLIGRNGWEKGLVPDRVTKALKVLEDELTITKRRGTYGRPFRRNDYQLKSKVVPPRPLSKIQVVRGMDEKSNKIVWQIYLFGEPTISQYSSREEVEAKLQSSYEDMTKIKWIDKGDSFLPRWIDEEKRKL